MVREDGVMEQEGCELLSVFPSRQAVNQDTALGKMRPEETTASERVVFTHSRSALHNTAQ